MTEQRKKLDAIEYYAAVWNCLKNVVKFIVAHIGHPRELRLTYEQARHVESLILGGSDPAAIGKAMNRLYDRKSFKYFRIYNTDEHRFEWMPADYEMDGLEYLHAAMIRLGAYIPIYFGYAKVQGKWQKIAGKGKYCYNPDHDIVKKLAARVVNEPVPQKKGV